MGEKLYENPPLHVEDYAKLQRTWRRRHYDAELRMLEPSKASVNGVEDLMDHRAVPDRGELNVRQRVLGHDRSSMPQPRTRRCRDVKKYAQAVRKLEHNCTGNSRANGKTSDNSMCHLSITAFAKPDGELTLPGMPQSSLLQSVREGGYGAYPRLAKVDNGLFELHLKDQDKQRSNKRPVIQVVSSTQVESEQPVLTLLTGEDFFDIVESSEDESA